MCGNTFWIAANTGSSMNKHLAMILVSIDQVDVTDTHVSVHWAQYPLMRDRITTYTIEEVIEWIMITKDDGISEEPAFLIQEYEMLVTDMICDFHESQTAAPFQAEIDFLECQLEKAKSQIRRFSKIITALQRRILKSNQVQTKTHHE